MRDAVVIGGGVIGLSIALELARDPGRTVLVLERDAVGLGTSWAAAGMLSPQSEADAAGPFFQLCMASLHAYRGFAAEVSEVSGLDPECDESGLLVLAHSEEELAALRSRANWQRSAGLSVEIVEAADVSELEPLVTAIVSGALFLPRDLQVTPRKLTASLQRACINKGVQIRSRTNATAIVSEGGRVIGVRCGGETVRADHIVVASGVWSGEIGGLSPSIPVSPRKGQILSLSMPQGSFRHMIRSGNSYFVPRRDGEVVVGATNEDAGFDRTMTPAGLGRLLTDAQRISSHVGSAPIRETWTGLRPATPDGLPVLGESDIKGLLYATGHFRNGILLAPVTAQIIAALVRGQRPPLPIDAFLPARFHV